MLTPAEALGLSGAALAARVTRALHHASDATLARITSSLREDARANDVVYEHNGVLEPVRIMARPLLVMPDQLTYVHHVCTKLTDALKRLPELYVHDADVRRVVRIREDEDTWVRSMWTPRHSHTNPVYGRLDAVCDFATGLWQQSLWFMEPNLSGVGGIHYAPLAESLVMRAVVPTILAHDPGLSISLPRDQRDLFLGLLLEHAEAMGRTGPVIALVEPKYEHEGPNEQPVLARFFEERHHVRVVHVDPRELRVEGSEVFFGDTCVDVAYRDYETRDLLALERAEGKPLHAMRLLFAQNRVISSLVGDFDHKSCWELLTDDALAARFFSMEERRTFRRHVLWTRVVGERKTSMPRGELTELAEYVRDHREELVLKPNRGYGGAGVCVGAATSQSEWELLLNEAVTQYEDPERAWVVQAATRLPVYDFPVVAEDGKVHEEPFYAVMGFASTDAGLGILCRVSQKHVVNVAQHGGLAATLIGQVPRELKTARRPVAVGPEALSALRAQIRELRHLDQAIGLLGWDEETYLPDEGRRGRGEQIGTLEALKHGLLCGDKLGDLMEEVAESAAPGSELNVELTLLRRLRKSALALPDELVRAHAVARSVCLAAWEEARDANDYKLFAPAFAGLLELTRARAGLLANGGDPYDALLDEHEPGMTRARMEPVLFDLRDKLTELLARVGREPQLHASALRSMRFPQAQQWEICRELLGHMGFSFDRGRLDKSTHPFTLAAGTDDVRLTIRVREDHLPAALFATLHEGGHGLFDQGFASEDRDSLLSDAPSMGLHESQARLWENLVGRSRAFWQGFFPRLLVHFPEQLKGLDAEALYRTVNIVEPSLNRVEADEVTYNLHIMLRYELEVLLLAGTLTVADLPSTWDEKCRALFGLSPKNVREGCLQDVHWSLGAFGYFPTYTFGNLYAAQLAETYAARHDLVSELSRGELLPLAQWLRSEIHRHGQRVAAEELVRRVTGKGLDAGAFLRALELKHGEPDACQRIGRNAT